MFGRIPKIPIDVDFGVTLPALSDTNQQNYAQKLKAQLKWYYKKVNEVNLKEATRHKKYYDRKFTCMKLVPGDTVLVRIKAFGIDRKIADKWEQQPYVVLKQMSNQPVFKVKPTGDNGEENVRTLHQNMLFSIQSNGEEPEQESVPVQNKNIALQKANLLMDAYFDSY